MASRPRMVYHEPPDYYRWFRGGDADDPKPASSLTVQERDKPESIVLFDATGRPLADPPRSIGFRRA